MSICAECDDTILTVPRIHEGKKYCERCFQFACIKEEMAATPVFNAYRDYRKVELHEDRTNAIVD